jgi:hypothetical protein
MSERPNRRPARCVLYAVTLGRRWPSLPPALAQRWRRAPRCLRATSARHDSTSRRPFQCAAPGHRPPSHRGRQCKGAANFLPAGWGPPRGGEGHPATFPAAQLNSAARSCVTNSARRTSTTHHASTATPRLFNGNRNSSLAGNTNCRHLDGTTLLTGPMRKRFSYRESRSGSRAKPTAVLPALFHWVATPERLCQLCRLAERLRIRSGDQL